MKKILITGASGRIGYKVLKRLLIESKYDIMILDLKSKYALKKLNNYNSRVKLIYGDINDTTLMDTLIQNTDYVIHLAGINMQLSEIRRDLTDIINYDGTLNIVNSIIKNGNKAELIYLSSLAVYGDVKNITVDMSVDKKTNNYFIKTLIKCENLIKKKIQNYKILRIAPIIDNIKDDEIFNISLNKDIELLKLNNLIELIVSIINKKNITSSIMNVSSGEKYRIKLKDYLYKLANGNLISFKMLIKIIFNKKNNYSSYINDLVDINNEFNYQDGSIDDFINTITHKHYYLSSFFTKLYLRSK